jgi:hypothetical protein
MKPNFAVLLCLVLCVSLAPAPQAISVHLQAPDPARGLIGVSIGVRLGKGMGGNTTEVVYFVPAEKAAGEFGAEDVIVSNFDKAGNVYLLNAKPGRYVAIGAEVLFAMPKKRTVVVFSKSTIPLTEIEARAGKVAFMGAISAESSMKWLELDNVQAKTLNFISGHSKTLGVLDRIDGLPYAYPSVIASVGRGEAVDSSFWSSAVSNHFRNEPAWQSLINARPVLPPEGAKVIK